MTARHARGYTLLEVIVAFALLAIALTLLLGTLTQSSRQVRWSNDAGRAAMLAQSMLDRTDMAGPLQPGEREGDLEDGRYHWAMAVRPYQESTRAQQPVDPNAPQLLALDLTLQWGDRSEREQLVLHSLRLVPPNAGGLAPAAQTVRP